MRTTTQPADWHQSEEEQQEDEMAGLIMVRTITSDSVLAVHSPEPEEHTPCGAQQCSDNEGLLLHRASSEALHPQAGSKDWLVLSSCSTVAMSYSGYPLGPLAPLHTSHVSAV
jgi:hypothetical protein